MAEGFSEGGVDVSPDRVGAPPRRDLAAHGPHNDIACGLNARYLWSALGWHDVRQRYRRSIIGPWWFTITTLVLVVVLGGIYSQILETDLATYLPFLASGLVLWQFISAILNESCETFIVASHMIKQTRLPLTVYVARMVWRNIIILAHTLPVIAVVLIVVGNLPGPEVLLIPFALLLLGVNGVWIGVVLGILCARFRDITPIVMNIVQAVFFITPVMWTPEILKDKIWIAELNPFYHMIEIVRAPLVGRPMELGSWAWAIGIVVAGFSLAQYMMKKYRDRVPYWL